jgi:hypothetical protein
MNIVIWALITIIVLCIFTGFFAWSLIRRQKEHFATRAPRLEYTQLKDDPNEWLPKHESDRGYYRSYGFYQKVTRVPMPIIGRKQFKYKQCMMMTLQEYAEGRLEKAPFLSINVSAETMPTVLAKVKYLIGRIAKNDATELLKTLGKQPIPAPPESSTNFIGLTKPSAQPIYTPFDYNSDRIRRVDDLQTQLHETFVNVPQQSQGVKQPFMFLGPVYLLTANHPVSVPPLQSLPPKPVTPDPTVPPEESAGSDGPDESSPEINIEFEAEMTTLPPSTQPHVNAWLFFPSMTKEGAPAPNYTFLGRSHRWMHRLLSSRRYVSRHGQCFNTCFGTPEYNMRGLPRPLVENLNQYYTACGLHRDVPDPLPEKPSPYPEYFYSVYELDLANPEVSQYVHPSSPKDVTQSIMTTDIDWSIHCSSAVISDNNKYFLVLRPFGIGIYYNERNEDILNLCRMRRLPRYAKLISGISFKGKYLATKMNLDERFLSIFGREIIYGRRRRPVGLTDEDMIMELRIAADDAQLPISVVLGDDGKVVAYDRYNKPCTDPSFAAAMSNDMTNVDLSSLGESSSDDQNRPPFDAKSDRERRLLDLKNYLILIGIMKQDPTLAPAVEAVQDVLGDITVYDSKTDYQQRLYNLAITLETMGIVIPEELRPHLPTSTSIGIDQASPAPIPVSVPVVPPYDQRKDQMDRIVQLGHELGVEPTIYFD